MLLSMLRRGLSRSVPSMSMFSPLSWICQTCNSRAFCRHISHSVFRDRHLHDTHIKAARVVRRCLPLEAFVRIDTEAVQVEYLSGAPEL